MLARERQSHIRTRLEQYGSVIAADLSAEFGVSEDTIRRDLREMAAAGICERVYGGAMVRTPQRPLAARLGEEVDAKRALGAATAALLPEDAVVFMDAGSTNLAVAQAIGEGKRLTIITNAPAIAAVLTDRPEIELIVIGGRIDPQLGAAVDARAASEIGGLNIDAYVIGACGFDPQTGLTAQSFEEQTFKRAVTERSARIIAALTAAKFSVRAPFNVVPLSERLTLVVEDGLPERVISAIGSSSATLVEARGPGAATQT